METEPGKSRHDCSVLNSCATDCRSSEGSCEVSFLSECCNPLTQSTLRSKRRMEHTCDRGSDAQRVCQQKDYVFAHANMSSTGEFNWGEVLFQGKDVQVFEDRDAFISCIADVQCLVTWKGIFWGKSLGLVNEIKGCIDLWCCIASNQAFVPKLEQFQYTSAVQKRISGEISIVGQLCSLFTQWNECQRLRYTPLNGGKYPWENLRGWSCNELLNPIDASLMAMAPPSWMDSPVNIKDEVAWLTV